MLRAVEPLTGPLGCPSRSRPICFAHSSACAGCLSRSSPAPRFFSRASPAAERSESPRRRSTALRVEKIFLEGRAFRRQSPRYFRAQLAVRRGTLAPKIPVDGQTNGPRGLFISRSYRLTYCSLPAKSLRRVGPWVAGAGDARPGLSRRFARPGGGGGLEFGWLASACATSLASAWRRSVSSSFTPLGAERLPRLSGFSISAFVKTARLARSAFIEQHGLGFITMPCLIEFGLMAADLASTLAPWRGPYPNHDI